MSEKKELSEEELENVIGGATVNWGASANYSGMDTATGTAGSLTNAIFMCGNEATDLKTVGGLGEDTILSTVLSCYNQPNAVKAGCKACKLKNSCICAES